MEYFVKMIGDKVLFKVVWYNSSWIEYPYENKLKQINENLSFISELQDTGFKIFTYFEVLKNLL